MALVVGAIIGTLVYSRVAFKLQIVAVPNERTLHGQTIPQGGGVVIAVLFLGTALTLQVGGRLQPDWFWALMGGGVMAVTGIVDDARGLSQRLKFAVQILCVVWALSWAGGLAPVQLGFRVVELGVAGDVFALVGFVWFINIYNFMDGVDGMAASGTVFFSVAAGTIVAVRGDANAALLLWALGASSLGFVVWNWPPARIFLGDSGSGFLGYTVGVMILLTTHQGSIGLWTWLILLSYFLTDTTATLLVRMTRVRRFWAGHRSHAYQNLARIRGSHLGVTIGVVVVQLVWLLPLALGSVAYPRYGTVLWLVSAAPIVPFVLRYGSLYKG